MRRIILAVMLSAAASFAINAAAERLLLRSGGERAGDLQSCTADQCRLSGETIARSTVAWIGFNGRTGAPPVVPDPTRDAVFLLDGSVRAGSISGISFRAVAVDTTSVPRTSVAWVWFGGRSTIGGGGSTNTSSAPPDTAPGVWTGTVTGRYYGMVSGTFSDYTVTVNARMREIRSSPLRVLAGAQLRVVGTLIDLQPQGTSVNVQFRSTSPTCAGTGGTTITVSQGDTGFFKPSVIYKKTVDVDTTATLGFNAPLGDAALYQVGMNTPDKFTYTCAQGGQSSIGYLIPALGRTPLLPPGPNVDPQLRTLQEGGRRMRGSYTTKSAGAFEQLEVAWDLMRLRG